MMKVSNCFVNLMDTGDSPDLRMDCTPTDGHKHSLDDCAEAVAALAAGN